MMGEHNSSHLIEELFPSITSIQLEKLHSLAQLYKEWNTKINLISRKDIDSIFEHHILHSLVIGRFLQFKAKTIVLDVGTGGGLPAIPLAILFPEVQFIALDSIAKKIKVVTHIQQSLGLDNLIPLRSRAEELTFKVHFIVSRAALKLVALKSIAQKLILRKEQFNALPNGLILLKGGDLTEELSSCKNICTVEDVITYIQDPYYEHKKIVYLPI